MKKHFARRLKAYPILTGRSGHMNAAMPTEAHAKMTPPPTWLEGFSVCCPPPTPRASYATREHPCWEGLGSRDPKP